MTIKVPPVWPGAVGALLTAVQNAVAGLATKLDLAGGHMAGALAMDENRITGLPAPTGDDQPARPPEIASAIAALQGGALPNNLNTLVEIVGALGADPNLYTNLLLALAGKIARTGDAMAGPLSLGGHALTNLSAPGAATDAARLADLNALLTIVGDAMIAQRHLGMNGLTLSQLPAPLGDDQPARMAELHAEQARATAAEQQLASLFVSSPNAAAQLAALEAALADGSSFAATVAAAFGNLPDGTVTTPGLRFGADQDSGIYRVGADLWGVAAGGVQRGGFGGFGVTGYGAAAAAGSSLRACTPGGGAAEISDISLWATFGSGTDYAPRRIADLTAGFGGGWGSEYFDIAVGTGANNDAGAVTSSRVRVLANGNVGIGTTAPGNRLDVRSPSYLVGNFQCTDTTNTYSTDVYWVNGNFAGYAALKLNKDGNFWLYQPPGSGAFVMFTNDTQRLAIESGGVVRPGADNTQSLGNSVFRWSQLFAGTSTIATSDAREKTVRGALDAAELAAAKTIAAGISIFQLNEAIAAKGVDAARLHTGVIAQNVIAALTAQGLEPTRYAFVCHDSWEAIAATPGEPAQAAVMGVGADGEAVELVPARAAISGTPAIAAGERYGIRYEELAMFLAAAQEQRLVALEAAHG